MTRDEWRRAERVLTEALPLSTEQQKDIVNTAYFDDAIRRELLDLLQRTNRVLPSGRVSIPANAAPVAVWPSASDRSLTEPLLAANDTVADGRFHIIRQLGRGGMGDVYLASDTKMETLVALKVLFEPSNREAHHARVCSGHPNIVTIHDVFDITVRDQPMTVLVMEYVVGRSANTVIDDGP